jgi:hypothetical protein
MLRESLAFAPYRKEFDRLGVREGIFARNGNDATSFTTA